MKKNEFNEKECFNCLGRFLQIDFYSRFLSQINLKCDTKINFCFFSKFGRLHEILRILGFLSAVDPDTTG